MNLRLKTNLDTEAKLNELQSSLQLSSKAAVMRLAIAMSLKMNGDPRAFGNELKHYDIHKQNGSDYNRFTIFGDDELIYKVLMAQHLKSKLDDDTFFPELTCFHIERGIKELYADFRLSNNKNKFIQSLLSR